MNGTALPSPELPLPQPSSVERGGDTLATPERGEAMVSSGDGAGQQGPSSPMPMVDPSSFINEPNAATAKVISATPTQVGDDVDVIEKEWVAKAKAIVEKTKGDPRKQSSELGNFKAEYIKKRFNKDIKTAKDVEKVS